MKVGLFSNVHYSDVQNCLYTCTIKPVMYVHEKLHQNLGVKGPKERLNKHQTGEIRSKDKLSLDGRQI